jgi:hypothetical protein
VSWRRSGWAGRSCIGRDSDCRGGSLRIRRRPENPGFNGCTMDRLPLARVNDLVVQELAAEILVYDLKRHKAFCLNESLKLVYQACDGKTSFAELKARHHHLTDDLISLALQELSEAELLELSPADSSAWAGVSRRDLLARVGLASVLAVPAILSTVVPTPAQAASKLPLLANCTSNSDCASGFCTNGPPRCCVPGTSGIRGVSTVCCTAGVDCDTVCCVGAVPVSPSTICASFGGSQVSCP